MANRFWVGGTGTWDASDTTHWASSSNGAGGQSVPTSADSVIFDGSSGGGTVTVNHASLSIIALTMSAFTGTLDFSANNNNITLSAQFTNTGTATRTLNMGNGTWTLTLASSAVLWDMSTTTNLTFNANSSTILLAATASGVRTFLGGGATYNNFTVTGGSTGHRLIQFSMSNTFANMTFNDCSNVGFTGGTTQTVTGAFAYNVTSGLLGYLGGVSGVAANLSVANATTLDRLIIQSITKTGAGSITANNSYSGGNANSITINAPASGGGNKFFGS